MLCYYSRFRVFWCNRLNHFAAKIDICQNLTSNIDHRAESLQIESRYSNETERVNPLSAGDAFKRIHTVFPQLKFDRN